LDARKNCHKKVCRPALDRDIAYIVRDANNFPVAYVYFGSESGRTRFLMTKNEARTIAATIAKLPELLRKS
jgi:hypothetical protein